MDLNMAVDTITEEMLNAIQNCLINYVDEVPNDPARAFADLDIACELSQTLTRELAKIKSNHIDMYFSRG